MGIFGRGIAFNNSFFSRGPVRHLPPPPSMGRPMGPINFHYSESFTCRTNGWDALIAGLQTFAFTRMMFGGWGQQSVAPTPQGTTPQQAPAEDKHLKSLVAALGSKGTFTTHPDKDGYYIMTTKDGEIIEDTYQNLLDRFKNGDSKATLATASTVEPAGIQQNVTEAPVEEPTANPTEALKNDVENSVKGTKGAPQKATADAIEQNKSQTPEEAGEWTEAQKKKPYRLQMTVAMRINANSTATVVTPDGKTHDINVHTWDRWTAIDILGKSMKQKLADAGWKNVTLENQKFDYASDGNKPTGNVDKPKGAEIWTENKKGTYKKPHTITFAVSPNSVNSGSATVTTPDGKLHQVTTGASLTSSRARKDLVQKMIAQLKSDGWVNATVTNKNWPEDCY